MSKTTARPTVASVSARVDGLEAKLDMILARLDASEPAKVTRKPAKARKPQPKAEPKPTKGSQTRETLSRKDWNRTLTAKAKLAGGDTYKRVLAAWDQVSAVRETMTPDEALALFA